MIAFSASSVLVPIASILVFLLDRRNFLGMKKQCYSFFLGAPLSIIWLGSVFTDETVRLQRAVSPAANRWQYGLIRSLCFLGEDVSLIGHLPEPLWPNGRLLIHSDQGGVPADIRGTMVSYLNAPMARNTCLRVEGKKALNNSIRIGGKPKFIISYNISPVTSYLGLYAQKKYGIPWVCIIADAPGREPDQSQHRAMEERASGRIFLSWARHEECRVNPKLHLDGGIECVRECQPLYPAPGKKHIILYTGTLGVFWGG